MKKIRCDSNPADFLAVSVSCGSAYIDTKQGSESTEIELSPDKIRKLRKQLKRALIAIEGDDDEEAQAEEYKPGDRVYCIEGNDEGDDYCKSPSVYGINLTIPVKLISKQKEGNWEIEYKMIDGSENIGYAYEKSFGRRA